MRRRSSSSSERVKPLKRKAARPKRSKAPKATRNRGVSATGQEAVVARLTRERDEALLRETASSEILRLISKSPGNLELVFRAILEDATRICNANFGNLFRFDGEKFYPMAQFNTPAALLEALTRRGPFKPTPGISLDHVMRTKQVFHSIDMAAEPVLGFSAKLGGARTQVTVPMLKDDELIGAIVIYRQEVHPFTDKQIELVKNFAAQAVIAIENARLLNELRQRTADLAESLDQQGAASEVLKVISSSPGELEPIFQSLLENATRRCVADFGLMFRYNGDSFQLMAQLGGDRDYVEYMRREPFQPGPETLTGRVLQTRSTVQIEDFAKSKGYLDRDPLVVVAVERGKVRTTLGVPMLRDNELIGVICLYRKEVRLFTDRQVKLLQNFAAQAVIATENARLLSDLRESLQRQTATADVLRIINSSAGKLEPVFQAILENAVRICEAALGFMVSYDGETFHPIANVGGDPAFLKFVTGRPLQPGPETVLGRVKSSMQTVQVEDLAASRGYAERDPIAVAAVELAQVRTFLGVPMIRDDKIVGVILLYRQEVRLFADQHVALVENFAAQAVIAIENARLLSELRQRTKDLGEALEQQTATADVLRVISSSAGDLEPVFQAMLEKAIDICDAKFGTLFRFDGSAFQMAARVNTPAALAEFQKKRGPFLPPLGSNLDRMMKSKQVQHSADDLIEPVPAQGARLGGARSIVHIPMLKDDQLMGALVIYRQEVRPFTEKQIALLQNFAAQAVIAIENARLLGELRQQTEEVSKLNRQLKQRVTDQVGEIERMSRLRRFLPPQVADLIVASGTEKQLESHRQEITALFCDLRGFTGFSESSDPEDVMALLAEYHAAIGTIINKYSGTLERYAGDGVMVIFNDPVPVENPALQAVLMALDMRTAIGGLIEKWRDLGHDLGFGIGIAHGFATLGTIGFEGRRDYAAIGTVSNVASRLCDEAKPGQILISPRVRQAIEKAVTVESVGEFELKGIRRPMMAYNVLGKSPPDPREMISTDFRS